jgi:hypothetical protein
MVSRRVDAPQEVGEHVECCGTSVFSQAASTRRPSHLPPAGSGRRCSHTRVWSCAAPLLSRSRWQRPGVRLAARPLRRADTCTRAPPQRRPVGSEAHTNRFSGRAAWVPTRRRGDRLLARQVRRVPADRLPEARCAPTENARLERGVKRGTLCRPLAPARRIALSSSHARARSSTVLVALSSRSGGTDQARAPHPIRLETRLTSNCGMNMIATTIRGGN